MQLKVVLKSLGIEDYPPELEEIYPAAAKMYEEHGYEIALGEKQREYIKKYNMFSDIYDDLKKTADFSRKNEAVLRYLYLLQCVMSEEETAKKFLRLLFLPRGLGMEYDLCGLLAVLQFAPKIEEHLLSRGLPHKIIEDTFDEFGGKAVDFRERFGNTGISIFLGWLQNFINLKIIRVDRFNFEMKEFSGNVRAYKSNSGAYKLLADDVMVHRSGQILGSIGCEDEEGSYHAKITEDDALYTGFAIGDDGLVKGRTSLEKSSWSEVLRAGDPVLSVHIPARLSLAPDVCDASYKHAAEIFRKHYPEFDFRAMCCFSWMMDPSLYDVIGKQTNLTMFLDRYIKFPAKSRGTGVMSFVFLSEVQIPPEKMPENTSLQRSVKAHYMAGKYIYEQGGVFFDV
ncbi:MAG: acyltransferase domain-containing protein [Firmicutes bacterium]|nr:acyltransferase domain-containing protein [Bacillota bacterium]